MAKSKKSSKERSQGGGRVAGVEPRLQAFRQFTGLNFKYSPSDSLLIDDPPEEENQTDLMMSFATVQNNVAVCNGGQSLETVPPVIDLKLPYREKMPGHSVPGPVSDGFYGYTGMAKVCEDGRLYLGTQSGKVFQSTVQKNGQSTPTKVDFKSGDKTDAPTMSDDLIGLLSDVAICDDKTVFMFSAMTKSSAVTDQLIALRSSNALPNVPARFPEPYTPPEIQSDAQLRIVAKGDLKVSATETSECPFRVTLYATYVCDLGPTEISAGRTFYASKPTNQWHSERYLVLTKSLWQGDVRVIAIEWYYVEGDYSEPAFVGRTDIKPASNGIHPDSAEFRWYGGQTDTSKWTMANLVAPKQNYTTGPRASRCAFIDNQFYFWDSFDPSRIWIGGAPGNQLSVSPGTGGGFVDVEPGTKTRVTNVCKYRTQSGAYVVTALCDNPKTSRMNRYNLVETNISLSNEQTMKSWKAERVDGAVGTKSTHGAGAWADGLYVLGRYGLALTTQAMEYNSQIRTTYVSEPIEPVFSDNIGLNMDLACMECVNDIVYISFGYRAEDSNRPNLIFCYDINRKAWWTISVPVDEPITGLFQYDYQWGHREGLGIVTRHNVWLFPTVLTDHPRRVDFQYETGAVAPQVPFQTMHHLTQVEFRFDRFDGEAEFSIDYLDQFGRRCTTTKVERAENAKAHVVYVRVDARVRWYRVRISGRADFRMTHFTAKTYALPARMGIQWGFDSEQSAFGDPGSIHRAVKSYNDLADAIIP